MDRYRLFPIFAFPIILAIGIVLIPVNPDYGNHELAVKAVQQSERWFAGHLIAAIAFAFVVWAVREILSVLPKAPWYTLIFTATGAGRRCNRVSRGVGDGSVCYRRGCGAAGFVGGRKRGGGCARGGSMQYRNWPILEVLPWYFWLFGSRCGVQTCSPILRSLTVDQECAPRALGPRRKSLRGLAFQRILGHPALSALGTY